MVIPSTAHIKNWIKSSTTTNWTKIAFRGNELAGYISGCRVAQLPQKCRHVPDVYKKKQIFIILAARGICQNQNGENSFHDVTPGQRRIFAVMATVFDFMSLGIER